MLFCLLASLLQLLTFSFLFTLTILKSRIRKNMSAIVHWSLKNRDHKSKMTERANCYDRVREWDK
jgi:hypothetical protein